VAGSPGEQGGAQQRAQPFDVRVASYLNFAQQDSLVDQVRATIP